MALLQLLLATVKLSQGGTWIPQRSHLGKGERVIFQYSDANSPVRTVKMIPEHVTISRGHRAYKRGAETLRHAFWEVDFIYLR